MKKGYGKKGGGKKSASMSKAKSDTKAKSKGANIVGSKAKTFKC